MKLKSKSQGVVPRFLKRGAPWVFANELEKIDTTIPPGSWVSLETAQGEVLGYGHFNPHSLIAFRVFERGAFRQEQQTRALFFKRLDAAWRRRIMAYPQLVVAGQRGVRLCFGESDGVPGLIIDLYESAQGGVAVMQCHAAGADQFVYWAQQWLEERLGISRGVIRNDLEVRTKEKVERYVKEWGAVPQDVYAHEGGLRFYCDVKQGQKTGFFYDHRDNRLKLSQWIAAWPEAVGTLTALDCFSYVGAWGLALAKAQPRMKVFCVDVSKQALQWVRHNAEANGLSSQIEIVEADILKDRKLFEGQNFNVVVSDPPSMSSSAKHAEESRKAHEKCFYLALKWLAPQGLAALSACSYHMTWDEFLLTCSRAAQSVNEQLVVSHVGGQAADHPVLGSLAETRYLKCAFVEAMHPTS